VGLDFAIVNIGPSCGVRVARGIGGQPGPLATIYLIYYTICDNLSRAVTPFFVKFFLVPMLTDVFKGCTLLHMVKPTHIGLRVNNDLLDKIDRYKDRDKRESRAAAVRVILEKYFEEHPETDLDRSDKIQ